MRLKGNIQDIKAKRDSNNSGIEIHLDKIEYITQKKDGKYYQPFDLVVDLAKPLVITGDCLARIPNKQLEEGEYEFEVYDKVGDDYVLNPGKELALTVTYDFDADLNILTEVYYTVTIDNEEFKQLKTEQNKARKTKGRK
ncbi:hypothetical protein JAO76_13515 [Pontibacter sp. BT310]|uniref:Uncharacterized protein n=1 Tax=Pontibacter populi TaxID=890055 RepID=A0ABS6XDL6_9BACT|nr:MULTISPECIES: hypothetical protein [Pontibacter]MBJ6119222.1 hypothetical protein [Pontibacter sp. BT310]MBR0571650.1 hypothetical protein [Microvirga sp. STS03]MBW3366076.1 hypothetical protein [Pontibacter populi]